jgi:hypothetical protein
VARVPNPMPLIRNLGRSVRETEAGVRRFFIAVVLLVMGIALTLSGVLGIGAVLCIAAMLILVLTALEPSPYSSSIRADGTIDEDEEGAEEEGEGVEPGSAASALADREPAPTYSIRPPDGEPAPAYRIEPPPEEPLEPEEADEDVWV